MPVLVRDAEVPETEGPALPRVRLAALVTSIRADADVPSTTARLSDVPGPVNERIPFPMVTEVALLPSSLLLSNDSAPLEIVRVLPVVPKLLELLANTSVPLPNLVRL